MSVDCVFENEIAVFEKNPIAKDPQRGRALVSLRARDVGAKRILDVVFDQLGGEPEAVVVDGPNHDAIGPTGNRGRAHPTWKELVTDHVVGSVEQLAVDENQDAGRSGGAVAAHDEELLGNIFES